MNLLSGSGRLVLDHLPTAFTNLSATVETGSPGYVIVYVDNQTIGKDVWFDDVQVLHYNTRVLEENHYYPYGLTVSTEAMGVTPQPLKYNSKELEKSFGLEQYDYGARIYDPQIGRIWQPDPLAESRSWVSPFSWVQNNPINRIDPTGAIDEPVYSSSGIPRGETKEGFVGQLLIYDGDKDFTKMTKDELLESTKNDQQKATTYDQKRKEMSGEARANIWSDVMSKFEGQIINGEKFSMNRLDAGKVHWGQQLINAEMFQTLLHSKI